MSRHFIKYFIIILTLINVLTPHKSWSAKNSFIEEKNGYSKVRLISSYYTKDDEQKLIVGFHFQLKNGWKIYGKSDSSFTQPPVFNFTGSSNIDQKNFSILWPEAKIINEQILDETISYPVYEDEVIIPIEIKVLDLSKNSSINVKINYGICNNICIPAEQEFTLLINSGDEDKESLGLLQNSTKEISSLSKTTTTNKFTKITLLSAILISFIGGLILNIMPCVLPVLSIKLLSIINHSKSNVRRIRVAYSSTIFGILFCFIFLAVVVSSLKIIGISIGWGTQFQSPYFLIFLVIVLTLFVANLIGLFEINIGSFLSDIINKKVIKNQEKDDLLHVILTNFLSGILAVLLATPCSAPFLGTAISFAFSQDSLIIFTIFIFMALGLSFPYVILIIFPQSIKILPKPGNWMITVKNIMAGFLVATIAWLVFILSHNIGFAHAMIVTIFSTLIFLCLSVCAKFKVKKSIELLIIALLSIFILIVPTKISGYFKIKERSYNDLWVKFDEDKIDDFVNDGNVVIIDITADWCITCKVNKKLVLDSKEVIEKLKEPNIIAMRGDLTTPNREISEFMESHNRYAIPFNIVYGPNARNGILLSELLSKKSLLEIIETAK